METGTAVLRLDMHSKERWERTGSPVLHLTSAGTKTRLDRSVIAVAAVWEVPEDCPLLCPYAASNKHPSNATTARANLHRFSVRSSARYASKSGLKTPA